MERIWRSIDGEVLLSELKSRRWAAANALSLNRHAIKEGSIRGETSVRNSELEMYLAWGKELGL
jgi:hypothetical protein